MAARPAGLSATPSVFVWAAKKSQRFWPGSFSSLCRNAGILRSAPKNRRPGLFAAPESLKLEPRRHRCRGTHVSLRSVPRAPGPRQCAHTGLPVPVSMRVHTLPVTAVRAIQVKPYLHHCISRSANKLVYSPPCAPHPLVACACPSAHVWGWFAGLHWPRALEAFPTPQALGRRLCKG